MADDSAITIPVETATEAAALLKLDARQEQDCAQFWVRLTRYVPWRLSRRHSLTMQTLRRLEAALRRQLR